MIFKQINAVYQCHECGGSPIYRAAVGGGYTLKSLVRYAKAKCSTCRGDLDLIELRAKIMRARNKNVYLR